ncbi:hypothetical protein DY000_02014470 [Brassica cretica]|uniref:Uncharacterized protein n=1 Tax=Brassica cretica TaxID=69181 RepID=A0ABQ7CN06_BRACR|nr:hypothetical protein DY000_02014470 [Brassica cretica]
MYGSAIPLIMVQFNGQYHTLIGMIYEVLDREKRRTVGTALKRLEQRGFNQLSLTGAMETIHLVQIWMDAGVGAGASLNRNLEAGVLPEAWMIFPNQFAPYFSILSSNSGNNLCTQVLLRSGPCSNLGENKFPGDKPGPSKRFQFSLVGARPDGETFDASVGINIGLSVAGRFRHLALHVDWTARLIGLAGEDHLYLLKFAVGDLLPRSEAGILDLGFALQTYILTLGWRSSVLGSNRVKTAIFLIPSSGGTRPFVEAWRPILCRTILRTYIAPGGESSSCCLEPIVSIDFTQHRTLSSGNGPLSISTGCGSMSRLRWLPFADPFRMSSGPYMAASLFRNCCGTRGPEDYRDIVPKPRVSQIARKDRRVARLLLPRPLCMPKFETSLMKIAISLDSLMVVRNRDVAFASVDGSLSGIQLVAGEGGSSPAGEEAKLSSRIEELAAIDGDFDSILAGLKSECNLFSDLDEL